MWVWTQYIPHTDTHTDCTSEAESRDLRDLRSAVLSQAKVLPLGAHAGSFWFANLPQRWPEKDSLNLISPCKAVGLGRQLFHLLPKYRSSRSWSVSSEEPLGRGRGVRWTWLAVEALGALRYPSTQGNPSYPPPSFSFSSSLSLSPRPLCNSLPPPHVALSSLLLQNWPKVLLLDSRVVRIHESPPHMPRPHCHGPGRGVAFISSGLHSA